MIDAVLLFGVMNIVFEYVLISMMRPKTRLRILGNPAYCNLMHIGFLLANLAIHWGTVVGTMASVMAFISSMLTVKMTQMLYGYIKDDRYYHVGYVKYSIEELQ